MTTFDQFTITWIDHKREAQNPPDPAYPKGMDVDITNGVKRWCKTDLSYPAQRCGLYVVKCLLCGLSVGLTTAGRPDDPRSLKMSCKMMETAQ